MTTSGVIESVAIARITPTECRFVVVESAIPDRPDDSEAEAASVPRPDAGRSSREIDLPGSHFCRWGLAAPRPVGPQALLACAAGSAPLPVAGRLEAFDGQTIVLAGGDLGRIRLPAPLVDRWVATASVASRPIDGSGPTRQGPRLLLVNGDLIEPVSVRIAAGDAVVQLVTDSEAPSGRNQIDCPLERISAVLPAARTATPAGPSILVVLADGSRIPVVGLAIDPPPGVDGLPRRRTARLLPAWDGEHESQAPQPLTCDADAITAVESHPAKPARGACEPAP